MHWANFFSLQSSVLSLKIADKPLLDSSRKGDFSLQSLVFSLKIADKPLGCLSRKGDLSLQSSVFSLESSVFSIRASVGRQGSLPSIA